MPWSRIARFAVRGLAREPGYVAAFVLTLGLGIGASTAIFSAVEGVLIRPLPYPHAHRIVYVQQSQTRTGLENAGFSFVEIADYRAQVSTIEELVEYGDWEFNVVGRGEPHLATGGLVTANYFKVLGLRPYLGRVLTEADDARTAEPVAVLTHEYWTRVFGAEPSVVGRPLELSGIPVTVVGVLHPGSHYAGTERAELYANYPTNAHYMSASMQEERSHRMTDVYALLREGASLEAARTEVRTIADRLRTYFPNDYPESAGYEVRLTPWREVLTHNARSTLLILMAAVGLVLVVACANVGNLTLTRLVRRERHLAVQAAIGATPRDVRRGLLLEHLILALAGAALGVVVARGLLDALVGYAARFTVRAAEVGLNPTVLTFALVLGVSTACAMAYGPRLSFFRRLPSALTGGTGAGGSTARPTRRLAERTLVVGQVAVSFVLLVGAALLVQSFVNVQRIDPGVRMERIIVLRTPNYTRRNVQQNRAFFEEVTSRLSGYPGVLSVATALRLPFDGTASYTWHLRANGAAETRRAPIVFNSVSPSYFSTLGVEILRGRRFTDADIATSDPVVVINESLATYAFGDKDPLGRRLQWSFDGKRWEASRTVIGVARDVRETAITDGTQSTVYESTAQATAGPGVIVRTATDPGPAGLDATRIIHALDPKRPVVDLATLETVHNERVAPWRLNATLFASFAIVSLAIAVAGIGAMLAFSVTQRSRELGIRMALGATRTRVLFGVLREGLVLVLIGIAIGAACARALSTIVVSLLFGTSPGSIAVYLSAATILLSAATLATMVPAYRATRVEPLAALRTE